MVCWSGLQPSISAFLVSDCSASMASNLLRPALTIALQAGPSEVVASHVLSFTARTIKPHLQVYFFVVQMGSACWALPLGQFSIQKVFWDPPIFQPHHVTKPAQASLLQQGEHAGDSHSLEDSCVCHLVLPGNTQDASETEHVDSIKFLLLLRVQGPRLATI